MGWQHCVWQGLHSSSCSASAESISGAGYYARAGVVRSKVLTGDAVVLWYVSLLRNATWKEGRH
jgi:hypothetical protein